MFGRHVHAAVLAAGCKVSGCTVHFCDDRYDTGPIILQRCCPVLDDDTPDTLAARVFELEKPAYIDALRALTEGRVEVFGDPPPGPTPRSRARVMKTTKQRARPSVRGVAANICLLASILLTHPCPASPSADRARAIEAIHQNNLPLARQLLEDLLSDAPTDWALHYNLACVHALEGNPDLALASLQESISQGFTDFDHLAADPHLASLHPLPRFQTFLRARADILDARAKADLDAAIAALGPRYKTLQDKDLRLNYICAMDDAALDAARAEIARVHRWASVHLWPDTPESTPHWVTVILATPEDYVKFVPVAGVGGIYDHDRRLLVAQNIGPSLRHEFMHLLHYRRMARLGQRHNFWMQEGLGSLPEDFDGEIPGASWRTNILRRLARHNSLTPWQDLFSMPKERFTTLRPVAHYAQARGIFLYLQSQQQLRPWLLAYEQAIRDGAESPERSAFESVFGVPMPQTERAYRLWARDLPEVAERLAAGDASLGVIVSPGDGDGPRVEVVEDDRGFRAGNRLWPGDVIASVNGAPTPTMQDLVQALAGLEVGREVEVSVRRGKKRETIRVTLVAR